MRRNAESEDVSRAPVVQWSLSHPFREKLHFYCFNSIRNLGLAAGFWQLASLLIEKRFCPVFKRYVLPRQAFMLNSADRIRVLPVRSLDQIAPEALEFFFRQSTTLTFSWVQTSLTDGATFWPGYVQGTLAACCLTRDYRTDDANSGSREVYLYAVEVLAPFRRLGLAVPFLGEVCGALFAGGVENVWSETHPLNTASIRMHHRLGFQFRRNVRF